jgi:hypothetical protein
VVTDCWTHLPIARWNGARLPTTQLGEPMRLAILREVVKLRY